MELFPIPVHFHCFLIKDQSETHKTSVILKFFIHKLDASLQITVCLQMEKRKENQESQLVPDSTNCLLVPETESTSK